MPATARRHSDEEEFDLSAKPSPTSTDSSPSDPDNLEWRSVAPLVDNYTGAHPTIDRAAARRRLRRHKPFILSGAFLAGTLVFVELMGLVWVYALDLKTLRQEDALKKEIAQTSLQLALGQNQLASYKSSPLLTQWADKLGYRPIQASDFDDVTSNAPLPPPQKEEKKP